MFIYVSRNYTSAVTLSRPADVTCGKCSCRYRYTLVRRGESASLTPHGFGDERAERAARERAVRVAGKRLRRGVEPVACPECGWCQPDIVVELRRRSARPILHLAWVLPLVAAVALLAVWGDASRGFRRSFNQIDNSGQRMILAVTAFAVGSPVAVPLLRLAWVRQLNPNRDYPFKPGPVPGAPPAVRLDGIELSEFDLESPAEPTVVSDGALAYARQDPDVLPGGWVMVQILGLTCPTACCRCLGPSTHTKHLDPLNIGFCDDCSRTQWRAVALAVAIGLAPAAGLLGTGLAVADRYLLVGCEITAAGSALFGVVVAIVLAHRWSAPFRQRRFDAARNTVQLRFRNPGYTEVFRRHARTAAEQAAARSLLPPVSPPTVRQPPHPFGSRATPNPVRPNRQSRFGV